VAPSLLEFVVQDVFSSSMPMTDGTPSFSFSIFAYYTAVSENYHEKFETTDLGSTTKTFVLHDYS